MDTPKKVNFIKDWIQNYVDSMPVKAKSLVIGISGGIDSSGIKYTLCFNRNENNCAFYAN